MSFVDFAARQPGACCHYEGRIGESRIVAVSSRHAIVVAAPDLEAAVKAVRAATCDDPERSVKAAGVLLAALSQGRLVPPASREIGPKTRHDPALRRAARFDTREGIEEATRAVEKAAAKVKRSDKEGSRRRKAHVEALALLERWKQRKAQGRAEEHGVNVGDAWFDLRLLRSCLAAYGVDRGVLTEGGRESAATLSVVDASGIPGVALVMPFRQQLEVPRAAK